MNFGDGFGVVIADLRMDVEIEEKSLRSVGLIIL